MVQLFLQLIHDRSPDVQVKVIMTDDGKIQLHALYTYSVLNASMSASSNILYPISTDNTGWNSAQQVYGPDLKHLLCLWHVDK